MRITKDYDVARGVVVLTVENPPLPTTKHTIIAKSIADGLVDLDEEILRLTEDAEDALRVHGAVMDML